MPEGTEEEDPAEKHRMNTLYQQFSRQAQLSVVPGLAASARIETLVKNAVLQTYCISSVRFNKPCR